VLTLAPWLLAMAVLLALSAFFSASEAALFSLRISEQTRMRQGSAGERLAISLLGDADRLLSAILFCNLVVNITYFTLASIASLRMEGLGESNPAVPVIFAGVSLLVMIFVCEMLPKAFGVLAARRISSWVSWPLSLVVRGVDPIMPSLRLVNSLSTRFLWPGFKAETYLDVGDLQRMIQLSTDNQELVDQEQAVLQNIVHLSDIRVDEWMRPRNQFVTFRPPVSLEDIRQKYPPSGYLLVTEEKSEEVASAVHLQGLIEIKSDRIDFLCEPVIYLPWCATVADALERMRQKDREVCAVVNEFGETIGILTFEDILDTLFNYAPSRSKRILDQNPIHQINSEKWLVSGMTNLRQLSRRLQVEFPASRSLTISGVIQESLHRIAQSGDETDWGPFHLKVLEMPARGHMLVELTLQRREANS
jgi:putative hemolysin